MSSSLTGALRSSLAQLVERVLQHLVAWGTGMRGVFASLARKKSDGFDSHVLQLKKRLTANFIINWFFKNLHLFFSL